MGKGIPKAFRGISGLFQGITGAFKERSQERLSQTQRVWKGYLEVSGAFQGIFRGLQVRPMKFQSLSGVSGNFRWYKEISGAFQGDFRGSKGRCRVSQEKSRWSQRRFRGFERYSHRGFQGVPGGIRGVLKNLGVISGDFRNASARKVLEIGGSRKSQRPFTVRLRESQSRLRWF